MNEEVSRKSEKTVKSQRLASLDALRGFDMLWIIGGGLLIELLTKKFPSMQPLAEQMDHVQWAGFHFEDLIFPLFVFISGVAMAFATHKHQQQGASVAWMSWRTVRRALLLIFFGACYNGMLKFDWPNTRWCSVLGLFAVSGLIGGFIAQHTKTIKALLFWALGIFVGIAGIHFFLKIGTYGGSFAQGEMINCWFDQLIPGHLYGGTWDPEGPLNGISASVLVLLGCSAGRYLIQNCEPEKQNKNVLIFIATGLVLIGVAVALSFEYPIIKKAWTGSFNFLTAGIGFVLLAIFYWIIDVCKFTKWSFPFRVIGVNAITIYLMTVFPGFWSLNEKIFGGFYGLFGNWSDVVQCLTLLLLEWSVLYFFWCKKIFLKL